MKYENVKNYDGYELLKAIKNRLSNGGLRFHPDQTEVFDGSLVLLFFTDLRSGRDKMECFKLLDRECIKFREANVRIHQPGLNALQRRDLPSVGATAFIIDGKEFTRAVGAMGETGDPDMDEWAQRMVSAIKEGTLQKIVSLSGPRRD